MVDMNSITSMSSNALRITGMATGLDTETMIKQMMAAENMKVDKMKQNQQYTVWRQEAFRDIIKDLRGLRDSYLLIGSPSDTNMIKSANYSGSKVTSSDESSMTATALPGATNGSSSVMVTQIAKSAKIVGGNLGSAGAATKLSDLGIGNGEKLNITVGSDTASVTVDNTKTVQDLINTIYDTEIGTSGSKLYSKLKISFSELTGSLSIETRDTGANQSLKISDTNDTILKGLKLPTMVQGTKLPDGTNGTTVPGVAGVVKLRVGETAIPDINVLATDSINDIITKIKSADPKLDASFDSNTGKFSISTKDGSSLEIASPFAALGLEAGAGVSGQDAIVQITPPGSNTGVTVTRSSNNFIIDNINYNLIKDPNGTPYTVNLTTKANSEDSVKKIKTFVEKYNDLVKKINDKVTEKKEYNYKPLTEAQKKDMKEDDIKAWEEKAKKGVLKNDGDLQKILLDMRNSFMSGMDSAGIRLSEIGIDTYGGMESVSKPGQLKIDETKLKKALEERGDQVMRLFTTSEPTVIPSKPTTGKYSSLTAEEYEAQYKYDNTGIFKRIEGIINNSAGKFDSTLLKKAGYEGTASEFTNTITKQLRDQDKAIFELNKKLYDKQERYYKMFSRLETAMNQMNSQQSWLTQQLSG